MARTQSRTYVWRFDSPPQAIWPVLADSARFNEAAGLPNHLIEEIEQDDGSMLYFGRGRQGPFKLAWQELPVNWVVNRWFRHCRVFSKGPLASLCASLELTPEAEGCRGEYRIEAAPANAIGALILRAGFFEAAGRTFGKLAEDARRFARGETEQAFTYRAPKPEAAVLARVDGLVARIEETGHGHGLARRLADYLLSAQEVDLLHLRPLKLARDWAVPDRTAIELCLEAARAGLLTMRWDLLCPRCRVPKAAVPALDELPKGAHCETCNIDYDSDFSRNVELSFAPAETVRRLGGGEYCLFGPMSTPHIHVHLTLAPGESREVEAELPAGDYRLRTLQRGPECEVRHGGGGFPAVILTDGTVEAGAAAGEGRLRLDNRSGRELTAVIEERPWLRDALTADRATALQAFRDLFSDQVLRPGDEVSVKRIALLFTDLRGSTALFNEIGDAAAYRLVREHFAFLTEIVRRHDGAIVKTIGDAIMATFVEPRNGLAAALEVQQGVADFNARSGGRAIVIKLGLHEGPSIAVTLNGRLDYFGATVNMAARLQGQSLGGDIVVSAAMAEDPEVRALMDGLHPRAESTRLKGFDEPVAFFRLSEPGQLDSVGGQA